MDSAVHCFLKYYLQHLPDGKQVTYLHLKVSNATVKLGHDVREFSLGLIRYNESCATFCMQPGRVETVPLVHLMAVGHSRKFVRNYICASLFFSFANTGSWY